jgi:hypothetical protein
MKRKRPDFVERRRPLLEQNLIGGEARGRLAARRKGCLPLLTLLAVGIAIAAASGSGLH